MRKTLLSLLAATSIGIANLIGNAYASPVELNTNTLSSLTYLAKQTSLKPKTVQGPRYSLSTKSEEYFEKGNKKPKNNLEINIYDSETRIKITDNGANGITQEDFIELEHDFKTKDKLFLSMTYVGNNDFVISNRVSDATNKTICGYSIKTKDLDPITREAVRWAANYVLKWGTDVYSEIINSLAKNQVPDLPDEALKTWMNKVGSTLQELKDNKRDPKKGSLSLADEFYTASKEKLKKHQKESLPKTNILPRRTDDGLDKI